MHFFGTIFFVLPGLARSFLTTETDSEMSFYSSGNSEPLCYGYKRGVLQTPDKGGLNRRCLAL